MTLKHSLLFFLSNQTILMQKIVALFRNKNNTVVLIKNGKKILNPKIKNLKIIFHGSNNYIEILAPCSFINTKIEFRGNNSVLRIGNSCKIRHSLIHLGDHVTITIGKNFNTQNKMWLNNLHSSSNVTIGSNCLFSHEVLIRPSDGHTIYNAETKELLNPSKDIVIGNHVWIGQRAILLKGAEIPDNSIVGAGAIVNKKFTKQGCILAGSPARVVKENINWHICPVQDWYRYKDFV